MEEGVLALPEKFLKIFSKNPKVPQNPAVTRSRKPLKGCFVDFKATKKI
jgi:hypothetical protein